MKNSHSVVRCGFFMILIVGMVFIMGCESKTSVENSSKTEMQLKKSATFSKNDFSDADIIIKVPDKAPPHLKTLGNWSDICFSQEIIEPMSRNDGSSHISYFSKAHRGYLYCPVENADEPDPPIGAQNVFKRNTLHRIHETSPLTLDDEGSLFITPENEGWRIGDFAVSDDYIWWCELDDASHSWKLYEMSIEGGAPIVLLEDTQVEPVWALAPSYMNADKNRLVVQVYHKASKENRIYLREPTQNNTQILAHQVYKDGDNQSFYVCAPKINGNMVTWSKGKLGNDLKWWCYLYDIQSKTCIGIDAGKRVFDDPTVTGNHLCVRLKPEGQNFIDHDPQGKKQKEDANTYESTEIWHYDLAKKKWDFRISNKSPIYKMIGFSPISLFQLDAKSHYLTWRTEPETSHPLVIDLDTKIAYQIPMTINKGVEITGMDIVPEGLYWKSAEENAPLNKALLK